MQRRSGDLAGICPRELKICTILTCELHMGDTASKTLKEQMEALERGPTQRHDVGTGHPVINPTTAIENCEREEAILCATSSEQEKHIVRPEGDPSCDLVQPRAGGPSFRLGYEATGRGRCPTQMEKIPTNLDPSCRLRPGYVRVRGSDWPMSTTICRSHIKSSNPTVQVHEGEQPRLLPLSIGSGFHSSPRHVAAGSWLHSRLAKKMVQKRDGGDPVPRLHLHVN
jgi:hypothetical protein